MSLRRPHSGFSLIELMIVAGILAALLAAGASLFEYLGRERLRTQVLTALQEVRSRLHTLIETPESWQRTVENNATLGCLGTPPSSLCTHGTAITPHPPRCRRCRHLRPNNSGVQSKWHGL